MNARLTNLPTTQQPAAPTAGLDFTQERIPYAMFNGPLAPIVNASGNS